MGILGESGAYRAGQSGLTEPVGKDSSSLTLNFLRVHRVVGTCFQECGGRAFFTNTPSSPTYHQRLWGPADLDGSYLQGVRQEKLHLPYLPVSGLSQPLSCYSPVSLGPSVPHSL